MDKKSQYRKTPRAEFLTYDEGVYFVTICTKEKKHFFGEIKNGEILLTEIGKFVEKQLKDANLYNNSIEIPDFVVMPNHIHAVVICNSSPRNISGAFIGKKEFGMEICRDMPSACNNQNVTTHYDFPRNERNPNPSFRGNPDCTRHVPTLSKYINIMKGTVTKFAKVINPEFGWQSRFHDHCIRGNKDGNKISEYINNNISNWESDCFYEKTI